MRKADAMHSMFGFGNGSCGDCSHLHPTRYHDKNYYKCDVYGITNSEASDWRLKYQACGLKNETYNGSPIINYLKREPKRKNNLQIPGQLSLFD